MLGYLRILLERPGQPHGMVVDLKMIAMAVLRGPWPKTETIKAPELWKDGPVVVYAIRRMG